MKKPLSRSYPRLALPKPRRRGFFTKEFMSLQQYESPALAIEGSGGNTFIPGEEKKKPKHTYGMDQDFVILNDIPLFDEHGEYTAETLQQIVDNCNSRVADTGD